MPCNLIKNQNQLSSSSLPLCCAVIASENLKQNREKPDPTEIEIVYRAIVQNFLSVSISSRPHCPLPNSSSNSPEPEHCLRCFYCCCNNVNRQQDKHVVVHHLTVLWRVDDDVVAGERLTENIHFGWDPAAMEGAGLSSYAATFYNTTPIAAS